MNPTMVSVERWQQFSLEEQLGNIGVELSRAASRQQEGNAEQLSASLDRAHELITLTIADRRWISRLFELLRLREALSDWYVGGVAYGISLLELVHYCMPFAIRARKDR